MSNPFSTPKEWMRKAYYDAIIKVLKVDTKPVEIANKIKKEIDEVEKDGVDVEKLKKWVYATQDKKTIESIETWCQNFLEKREKENEKRNKEKNKEFKEKFNLNLRITNYVENVERFYKEQPFFYDKTKIFWFWNKKEHKWEIVDETDLMNGIDDCLGFQGETVTSKVKGNYLEAFKRVGRKKHPKDAPLKWVQFKDKAFSIKSKKTYDVTPDYFFTNPIPWEMGETSETPVMDKLFKEWVGKDYVKTLYEIIAYCCYRSYPIHMCFCLIGGGRNGKTQFQKIVSKFIGNENITSSSLDAIRQNRFETFKMYLKLVCLMGETNFGLFDDTDTFKRITGGDPISYEKKGKDGFTGYSYATVLINSNSLPITQDTSEGFYRRWFIIDFPNQFKEGKDIINTIPDEEYNNLARKITEILPVLLEKGMFTKQGSIDERKNKYVEASNPLSLFLEECCYCGDELYEKSSELYAAYTKYLKHKKRRLIKRREFSTLLQEEGYIIEKKSQKIGDEYVNTYFAYGIKLKENWDNFGTFGKNGTHSNSICLVGGDGVGDCPKSPKSPKNKPQHIVVEEIKPQHIVVKEKLTKFLQKQTVKTQHFSEMLQGLGIDEQIINEVIEKGIIKGEWYESRPGYLTILK